MNGVGEFTKHAAWWVNSRTLIPLPPSRRDAPDAAIEVNMALMDDTVVFTSAALWSVTEAAATLSLTPPEA